MIAITTSNSTRVNPLLLFKAFMYIPSILQQDKKLRYEFRNSGLEVSSSKGFRTFCVPLDSTACHPKNKYNSAVYQCNHRENRQAVRFRFGRRLRINGTLASSTPASPPPVYLSRNKWAWPDAEGRFRGSGAAYAAGT